MLLSRYIPENIVIKFYGCIRNFAFACKTIVGIEMQFALTNPIIYITTYFARECKSFEI